VAYSKAGKHMAALKALARATELSLYDPTVLRAKDAGVTPPEPTRARALHPDTLRRQFLHARAMLVLSMTSEAVTLLRATVLSIYQYEAAAAANPDLGRHGTCDSTVIMLVMNCGAQFTASVDLVRFHSLCMAEWVFALGSATLHATNS